MKIQFKKIALYVGAIMGGILSYIGALAMIAYFMNGDERSLFIAILPAVVVAYLIATKGGVGNA